jgi:Concanavalin A-like lectin/glucanases superfamily
MIRRNATTIGRRGRAVRQQILPGPTIQPDIVGSDVISNSGPWVFDLSPFAVWIGVAQWSLSDATIVGTTVNSASGVIMTPNVITGANVSQLAHGTLTDTSGLSASWAFHQTVVGALNPPSCQDDPNNNVQVGANQILVNVLANDSNVIGASLSIVGSPTPPGLVTAAIVSGQVQITSHASNVGAYSVTYQATNLDGSDTAVVSGTVFTPIATGLLIQLNMNDLTGTTLIDAQGVQNGAAVNVTLNQDPVANDGTRSVLLSGSSSIKLTHAAQMAIPAGSIVIYVQANDAPTSGNRQIVFKDGSSSTAAGAFAIEQHSNGIQVYYRNASAALVEFANGITFTAGVGHRLIYTWGPTGHHLWRDNLEVASDADTSGTTLNFFDLWLGSYLGVSNGFVGYLDRFELWGHQLTAGEISGLPAALTVSAPPPPTTAALVRPTIAFATGQDTVPTSNVIYIAPNGNNANPGTSGSPKQTLEGAQSALPSPAPGWTIVCRGGNYNRTGTFAPNKSGTTGNPITVMAYPGETVIMDRALEFAAFRSPGAHWTQIDSTLKIWRSNATGFAAGRLQGHWKEGGEEWFIWGYLTDNTERNHTGSAYEGPMARVESDGRVYIRFQRPSSARTTSGWVSSPWQPGVSGGVFVVPGSENPNDYPVYLSRQNASIGISWSGVSDWLLKDINWIGSDFQNQFGGTATRIEFRRGLWVDSRYGNFFPAGRTTNGLTWKGIQATQGRLDYFPYDWLKSLGGNNSGQMDNNAFFANQGTAPDSNWTIEDCVVTNYHDWWAYERPPVNLIVRHNWLENMQDDTFQIWPNSNGIEWAYNVFYNSPYWSISHNGSSSVGHVYIHHNIGFGLRPRLYGINILGGPHNANPTHFFSGASGRIQPQKIYNNTLVYGSCAGDFGSGIPINHMNLEADNTDSSRPHEAYNNLVMVFDRFKHSVRFGQGQHDEAGWNLVQRPGSNEIYDNNHYCRVLGYSPAIKVMYQPCWSSAKTGGSGTQFSFSNLAALRTTLGQELQGTEESFVGVGTGAGMGTNSPLINLEALDFRPKSGHALNTGAKALLALGWPGATNNVWRGAIDPTTGLCPDGRKPGPPVSEAPVLLLLSEDAFEHDVGGRLIEDSAYIASLTAKPPAPSAPLPAEPETTADASAFNEEEEIIHILPGQEPIGGLIARWALDETTGTVAIDSATFTYPASFVGSPIWRPTGGVFGGALELNGTNQCLDASGQPNLFNDGYSYTIWIKPATVTGQRGIISKISNFNGQGMLVEASDSALKVYVDRLTPQITTAADTLVADVWQFLAVVLDFGTARLYQDGQLIASASYSSATRYPQSLFIGRQNNVARFFGGLVDDVRVYNQPLDALEVLTLYNEAV